MNNTMKFVLRLVEIIYNYYYNNNLLNSQEWINFQDELNKWSVK